MIIFTILPSVSQGQDYKIIENPEDCSYGDINLVYKCDETLDGNIQQGKSIGCNVTIKSTKDLKFNMLTRIYFAVNYKKPGSNTWVKISDERINPFTIEKYYKIYKNYSQETGAPLYFLDEPGLWKIKLAVECVDATDFNKSREAFRTDFTINVMTPEAYSQLKTAKDQIELMKMQLKSMEEKRLEDVFVTISAALFGTTIGGIITFFAQKRIQKREWTQRRNEKFLDTVYSDLYDNLVILRDMVKGKEQIWSDVYRWWRDFWKYHKNWLIGDMKLKNMLFDVKIGLEEYEKCFVENNRGDLVLKDKKRASKLSQKIIKDIDGSLIKIEKIFTEISK